MLGIEAGIVVGMTEDFDRAVGSFTSVTVQPTPRKMWNPFLTSTMKPCNSPVKTFGTSIKTVSVADVDCMRLPNGGEISSIGDIGEDVDGVELLDDDVDGSGMGARGTQAVVTISPVAGANDVGCGRGAISPVGSGHRHPGRQPDNATGP